LWNFASDKVEANITLYAKWTLKTYTVSFNSNGGSAVSPIANVDSASTITAPTAPTRTGYIFDGWYKEAAYTTLWNFASDKVTANITLYAKWNVVTPPATPKYTVTFNSNGGSAVSPVANVDSGTVVAAPTAPTRTGYTFDGWYKETTYATAWNFASDKVTANITLYAKWSEVIVTPPATPKYTVTFSSEGGSTVSPIANVDSGTVVAAPTAPTRTGYTFDGWYKEASYSTEWKFASDKVTANITPYAKWNEVIVTPPATPKYTVTFSSEGGSTVAPIANVDSGTVVAAPTAPTRTGYTFDGWYKEAAYATAWNFASDKVTANITLYAKWTPSTGIADNAVEALVVYPTITADVLTIANGKAGKKIWVYTTQGTVAATYESTGTTTTISIAELPQGLYIVKVDGKTARVVKR
jgi:uncharacterized repeat protein (TIGR02543 family)